MKLAENIVEGVLLYDELGKFVLTNALSMASTITI